MQPIIYVIIPAFNESQSISHVINDIPKNLVKEIIVVDNGSTDNTADTARLAGAIVLHQAARGYGNACLKGIEYCKNQSPQPDIVVFLDGDYSDYPEEMITLATPLIEDKADLVIGSRTLGQKEHGSITPQQVFGNWLATRLIALLYGTRFTDLGPFRAIRFNSLLALNMQDKTFGWTVEMQLKAAKIKMRCMEKPVRYRKRIGTSKISGTVKGTFLAGYKILFTIFRYL
ncbi:MAG: glycosyltransferase family 2 protein [Verrucomicrobia bacterium]|nr:glycosyltransferase family 2 protein [Cytophagales bacterium]